MAKSARVRLTAVTKGDKAEAIAEALAAQGIVLSASASAEKKNTGYAIFDTDNDITDTCLEELKSIDGVIAIRII